MKKSNEKIVFGIIVILLLLLPSVALFHLNSDSSHSNPPPEFTSIITKTPYGDQVHYVDKNGGDYLMQNIYSTVDRILDEAGRPVWQMYYHDGKQVALLYGQYGERLVYNTKGQIIERTYLDRDGRPMVAINGFSTVKQTYKKDGSLKTEKYYNTDGSPMSTASGHYGRIYTDHIIFPLNKNDHILFDLDFILNQIPGVVIIFSLILVFILCCANKKIQFITVGALLLFILYQTLFRHSGGHATAVSLFWSYRQFFSNSALRFEILNNVWLFVPIGTAVYTLSQRPRYLLFPILISTVIEILQLLFNLGLFELDDIFSNTLGACIGFVLAYEICKIKNRIKTGLKNASYENLRKTAFEDKD